MGVRVRIVGGKYAGELKFGEVLRTTAKMVDVKLDGGSEVRIMQASVAVVPPPQPFIFTNSAPPPNSADDELNPGLQVRITGGKYVGSSGIVVRTTVCKVSLKLDDGREVQISKTSIEAGSAAAGDAKQAAAAAQAVADAAKAQEEAREAKEAALAEAAKAKEEARKAKEAAEEKAKEAAKLGKQSGAAAQAEKLKQEGNDFLKTSDFNKAIAKY